jgi:hypothetical protein
MSVVSFLNFEGSAELPGGTACFPVPPLVGAWDFKESTLSFEDSADRFPL